MQGKAWLDSWNWQPVGSPEPNLQHALPGPGAGASVSSTNLSGLRVSNAAVNNMLHADRLRSADGTASHALTIRLLTASLAEARVRQTVMMLRIVMVAVPV